MSIAIYQRQDNVSITIYKALASQYSISAVVIWSIFSGILRPAVVCMKSLWMHEKQPYTIG